MISPKLVVLMAAFTLVGVVGLPTTAFADRVDVEIERNNEIEQSIEQEQEACTNELEGELSGEVEQFNFCDVDQTQTATNEAAIVDESDNDVDLESILADVGLSL
jgi:hypothetical protein